MARLYTDEHFLYPVVELLRGLGHDVLNVQNADKVELKISDRHYRRTLLITLNCLKAFLQGIWDNMKTKFHQPPKSRLHTCFIVRRIKQIRLAIKSFVSPSQMFKSELAAP